MADDTGIVLNLVENTPKINVSSANKRPENTRQSTKKKRVKVGHQKQDLVRQNQSSRATTGHTFNFSQSHAGRFPKSSSDARERLKSKDGGQSKEKNPAQQSSNIISSLFRYNPEIPQVQIHDVAQTKEAVFSSTSFADLPLHPFMVSNLEKNLGFSQLTSVQQRAIPTILQGKDTLVKSQTGTGKTLAYAVPLIQKLQGQQPKVQRSDGPYAVILVPTRELALQSFDTLQKLVKPFHWIVPGCLMGGEKKKSEKARIRRGINVLVSTPGRLVDHIETTKSLTFAKVRWVILDEADRLLDMGFEREVSSILNAINNQCGGLQKQTLLLSATLSEGVQRLASISLKDPVFIDVAKKQADSSGLKKPTSSENMDTESKTNITNNQNRLVEIDSGGEFTIPERLKQQFVIVPSKLRLVTLVALVAGRYKSPSGSKMLAFLSSRDSVDFHYTLFQGCLGCTTLQEDGTMSKKEGLPLFRLHGSLSQEERTMVYQAFCQTRKGLLLCTDVAARGLDLPKVKWIIQYNTPGSPADYVHRVGRTARIGKEGHALIFLAPSEVDYVGVLEGQQISVSEKPLQDILSDLMTSEAQDFVHGEFKGQMQRSVEEAATNLQHKFENFVLGDSANIQLARTAFHSFVRAYATYPASLKRIFHIKKLHLGHVAKSFGLREAPSSITNRIGRSSGKRALKGVKRKHGGAAVMTAKKTNVSEFGSGLDEGALVSSTKRQRKSGNLKRKKRNQHAKT